MSIFERIQRIARANINWLLDKAESPAQELEAKIQELEEAINEGREAGAVYGATFRRMERQAAAMKAESADWQAKAERAVAAGDDELARRSLSERVRLAERVARLEPGIEQGKKTYAQLRDNLVKLQDQLKSAKLKLAELRGRQRAAEAQKAFGKHLDRTVSATGEAVAFERMEDNVLQTEAEAETMAEIRGESMSDLDLEQRAREMQVDAELRAMKERLGKE